MKSIHFYPNTNLDKDDKQGCGAGCKIFDSNSYLSKIYDSDSRFQPFQNFRLRLLNIKGMKFGC